MRVVILGAGFGGLELATRLSEQFAGGLDVVLVDRSDSFVFGFSKLDVMFGRVPADAVRHSYRDYVKPGVQVVAAVVRSIDPVAKRVETDAGSFEVLLAAFAERGIQWCPDTLVHALDPARKVAVLGEDRELPYDLFLGVPVHRVPAVVAESGMTVDGWIPVDPLTLETAHPGVYAVGDVTSVGTAKAGVFAEGQAAVVADRIGAIVRGTAQSGEYGGRGICYLEFGRDQVAAVDVTFVSGQAPRGTIDGPSEAIAVDKGEFGSGRVLRWFGREWSTAAAASVPS